MRYHIFCTRNMSRRSPENDNYRLYWDRTLSTDSTVPFNRLDVTLADTTNKEAPLKQQLHYPTICKPRLQKRNANIRNCRLKSSSNGNWTRLLLFNWSRLLRGSSLTCLTKASLPSVRHAYRPRSRWQTYWTPIALWENSWMMMPTYLM
jgi:hypothetical protein